MSMSSGCNPQINIVAVSHFKLSQFLAQLLQKHIYIGYLVNATPPTILRRCF